MSEDNKNKRLLVMAGGTGGHIFPALAVAKMLEKKGWKIRWLGTADRMEATLVPNNGIEIDFIQVKGLLGSGFARKLAAPWMLARAIWQAKKAINNFNPDVVLGMGGYVSGPGGAAAYLSGVPVVLHEQNAVAGLTNRLLAKIATQVLQAFPSAFGDAKVVGNPLREEICALLPHQDYVDGQPLKILITGGSQGAQILNKTVPLALAKLDKTLDVRHQAGKGRAESTMALYQEQNLDAVVTEFIDDVANAYAWADIVICRSGALTVSEIAVAGVSAIFVPFMHKDRQQAVNADFLVNQGGALMIEQPAFNADSLSGLIASLDAKKLNTMAHKARTLAILDAAKRVADVIEQSAN